MFRGLASLNIDAKGRVTIPTQYRQAIMDEANGGLVITIDPEERCLLLYPLPQWVVIEEKLETLPTFLPATRRIQRLLIGHATELELDRSGRVLLPPLLREYAGLDKSIMLVGQGKRFEVWGESQWQMGRDAWLAEGLQGDDMPSELMGLSL
ncbi:MAG: division/cell wall cluster transcriptional repressor MraZ [Gammaproteobacteria bacterium]|nr:division/cell wall cluster transcriptional repressor MraZ [Gammaproteobacteria bacterium]MCH9743430.1 division/cell wall cluster transcriptional repressor MraZ [Gammaproteobacteria bacterium]